MQFIKQLLKSLTEKLDGMVKAKAVVAKPISVGDRHVVPLCELGMAFGGAGGTGEGEDAKSKDGGKGTGGGAGGGAKAVPVAVLVVEDGQARIEMIQK